MVYIHITWSHITTQVIFTYTWRMMSCKTYFSVKTSHLYKVACPKNMCNVTQSDSSISPSILCCCNYVLHVCPNGGLQFKRKWLCDTLFYIGWRICFRLLRHSVCVLNVNKMYNINIMPYSQVEMYDSFGANHWLLPLFQRKLLSPSSVCKIFWILLPPSQMITLYKITILRILRCTNNNAYTHINNKNIFKTL